VIVEVAVGGAALAWLLLRKPSAKDRPGAALEEDGQAARDQVRVGMKDRTAESALAGGFAFAGAGLALFGPPGLVLAGLGAFLGALGEAIGHQTYGVLARDALGDWLRANKAPHSSAAVDALLYRIALRYSRHVWVHARTGDVAVEVLERRENGDVITSMSGARTGDALPGQAAMQLQQQIGRMAPGQLDGPTQVRRFRAWRDAARVGALYRVEATPARESWRTPGYVYFRRTWPLVALTPTARTRDWRKVTVTADNVDSIAARFDAAAGVQR